MKEATYTGKMKSGPRLDPYRTISNLELNLILVQFDVL